MSLFHHPRYLLWYFLKKNNLKTCYKETCTKGKSIIIINNILWWLILQTSVSNKEIFLELTNFCINFTEQPSVKKWSTSFVFLSVCSMLYYTYIMYVLNSCATSTVFIKWIFAQYIWTSNAAPVVSEFFVKITQ